MQRSELRAVVEEIVREELHDMLPGLLKEVITEVMGSAARPASKKKASILEELEFDDDEEEEVNVKAVLGRQRPKSSLMELMGDSAPSAPRTAAVPRAASGRGLTLSVPQQGGETVELPADVLPDFLVKAMTRNYKGLLEATKDKR